MFSLPTRHSYSAAAISKVPLSTKWTERQVHFLIVLLSGLRVPCPLACLQGCSPLFFLMGGGGDHARWGGGGGGLDAVLRIRILGLGPGIRLLLDSGSEIRNRYCLGSGLCASDPESRIPNLYTWELTDNLWQKNSTFLWKLATALFCYFWFRSLGSGIRDPGWVGVDVRIRSPGSGTSIPDSPHCWYGWNDGLCDALDTYVCSYAAIRRDRHEWTLHRCWWVAPRPPSDAEGGRGETPWHHQFSENKN